MSDLRLQAIVPLVKKLEENKDLGGLEKLNRTIEDTFGDTSGDSYLDEDKRRTLAHGVDAIRNIKDADKQEGEDTSIQSLLDGISNL
ncbi:hypothetical protein COB52_00630 [Candidatus Kaiserbacteria bacterium]|nr:MAG: hypothetical protein COB52_00630 [Candidatus Kaiserbacteria bacterium]